MRDQREIIREAIKRDGRSQRSLSKALGKNEGYLSEYLRGEFEKIGAAELMKLTRLLKINPPLLDASKDPVHEAVSQSDATIYVPGPNDAITPQPHIVFLKVTSLCMDEHPEQIKPGHIAAFDSRDNDLQRLDTGRLVYIERAHGKHSDVLIRQFVAPDKLITNSSAANEIIRADDGQITIKGAFRYVFRGLGGG